MSINPGSTYAHPEALVSTEWLADHLNDPGLRVAESNEDPLLYAMGHIPGAVNIDWQNDLNDPLVRDYLSPEQFAALLSRNGIGPDTTVIFYGDKSNWWATYSFWVFQLYGHSNARVLNGGRQKWADESRALTTKVPAYAPAEYPVPTRDDSRVRAFREEVLSHVQAGNNLVDVRSPGEFSGQLLHMPNYPQEGALRGGHIPGAKNVPWATAANPDGTFKRADELRAIYEQGQGLNPQSEVITYCRIGERSSHTWFVLTYLLGYTHVRNYDGSWTEWGNSVRLPIEK